jgi:hypothetical protein
MGVSYDERTGMSRTQEIAQRLALLANLRNPNTLTQASHFLPMSGQATDKFFNSFKEDP